MALTVNEYAAREGITARAARLRAKNRSVPATKISGSWVILEPGDSLVDAMIAATGVEIEPEAENLARETITADFVWPRTPVVVSTVPRPGRPMSRASFEALASYLDGDSAHLSSTERFRARQRARRLAEDPIGELRRIAPARGESEIRLYRGDRDAVLALRSESSLRPTGSSDERQTLSDGMAIDAYIRSGDARRLTDSYGLEESTPIRWNVRLRVVDELPEVRLLRVAVDLIDDDDERAEGEAERIINGLVGALS